MPGPLINTAYVALIGNRTLTDAETTAANALIPIASNLVRSELKRDLSSTTAPEKARLAVARLVLSVLDGGSDGDVRAEQIADYRIEYQRSPAVYVMDVAIVADLLRGIKAGSKSVRTNVPQDGEDGIFDDSLVAYTGPGGSRGYLR